MNTPVCPILRNIPKFLRLSCIAVVVHSQLAPQGGHTAVCLAGGWMQPLSYDAPGMAEIGLPSDPHLTVEFTALGQS